MKRSRRIGALIAKWVSGRRYLVASVSAALLLHISHAARSLAPVFSGGLPRSSGDALLYQFVGWMATNGYSPYLHAWDIKPPLTFEVAAALAFISGGDPLVLHLSGITVSVLASVVTVAVSFRLVQRYTGSSSSALVASMALLSLPVYLASPSGGLVAKNLVLAAGVSGIYLTHRGNFFLGGATAAAAAGLWQMGMIFPAAALGLAAYRGSYLYSAGGMLLIAVVSLVPIAASGALRPMLNQVVLAPLVTDGGVSTVTKLGKGFIFLGHLVPLFLVGAYGIIERSVNPGEGMWVQIGAGFSAVQAVFLDLDGPPDLLLGFLFVSMGVGLLDSRLQRRTRQMLRLLVGLSLVVTLFAPSAVTDTFHTALLDVASQTGVEHDGGSVDAEPRSAPTIEKLYWNQRLPESCHFYWSNVEEQWVQQTDAHPDSRLCTGGPL